MLKSLIRSEIKEAIILLVFAGLLVETLTGATLALVVIGSIMVWFRKKPNHKVRNVITLLIFATYWMTYGKVIDPEIGINFLTTIIVLKLLEKETERDRYMIFFGLMLLISSGSLFQKSLSYVFFFASSFFILIQDFYKGHKLPSKLTTLLQSLLWVLPFTALLFFVAPRLMNPFQLQKGAPKNGEIGYTPEVNITDIQSLGSNDTPVFQALVDRPIDSTDLYWRGNTLSFSDGWNWPLMPQDRSVVFFDPLIKEDTTGIRQKIRVFAEQEFYFGFDHPTSIITSEGVATLDGTSSLIQNRWKTVQRYQVISRPGRISGEAGRISSINLKKVEKDWINQTFKSTSLAALRIEIESYFEQEKFSYSLSPGKIPNFLSFMRDKKIGFCSHYASAVAQILRTKNIQTRLVSGFMGGSYNKFARFYQVTQNDAHVWIEVYDQGQWIRLDPTEWISPDRVRLGGEAFMQQQGQTEFSPLNLLSSRFRFLNDMRQWFGQWDFKFYQWLEDMDYSGQQALLERLNVKREWIFSIVPLLLALFMAVYAWHLARNKVKTSELEILWLQFQAKLKKRGITLALNSIAEGDYQLQSQDEKIKTIWRELVSVSFKTSGSDLNSLKKKIQSL